MRDGDFQDLLAFAAVADKRSFRGAAAAKGVSASALSSAVRRLEARLGVRLLNRTTRSVQTTEAGLRLLDRLKPALAGLDEALDSINRFRERPIGTLRLNVPAAVARLILPDLIARFMTAYPEITVEVRSEDRFIDVLGEGFDAGIRYDERLEQDMIAVPIGPRWQRYVCVAAPSYVERHGSPKHPRDLLAHACIRHRFAHGTMLPWEFEREGEVIQVSPSARLVTDSLELQRAAVVAGIGVAATFEGFFADLIESGDVIPLLPDWSTPFTGPFLFYHDRRHVPAPLRAFIDFLRHDSKEQAGPKSVNALGSGMSR
ncbi:LysR family transcriptional regulator [Aquidulcibacter paucihalophilus]|uniref:LysR family transcriptional regulator n=1 Tax=Aquidulcibacter paucihalophilus TaxID=1978549 RepID=UPI000A195254|nr:LysR family transcriptional regulator [Aquidulcibacter paucihalophilus]